MGAANFNIAYKVDSSALKNAEGNLEGFGSKIKGLFTGFVALGAIKQVGDFTKELVTAGEESLKSDNRIKNIAQSMGIFGSSADNVSQRLLDLADKQAMLTGTDDDIIKGAQAKLLTFANLAKSAGEVGGAFDRATLASQDLAAAGFGSVEGNATALGKALQDPIKGLTSLSRMGVTFTETQKDMVKAMVAGGDAAGAQNLILKSVEQQVGGTAEATASASDKMKVGWENLKETLGQQLLPVFDSLAATVTDTIIPAINDFIEKFKAGKTPINAVADAVKEFINFVKDNWTWISTLGVAIIGAKIAFEGYNAILAISKAAQLAYTAVVTGAQIVLGLLRGETIAATAAQLGLNAAMLLNPIALIVVAVAALTAGLVYFFTQTKAGQATWKAFTDFLKSAWASVAGAFTVAWNAIATLGKTVFNGLATAAESVINRVIGNLNGLINVINIVLSALKTVSGGTINLKIPNVPTVTLPKLATGGIVKAVTGGQTVTVAEGGQAEAIIPLNQIGNVVNELSQPGQAQMVSGGSTMNVNVVVNAGMGANGADIGRQIVTEIKRYERTNGAVWATA